MPLLRPYSSKWKQIAKYLSISEKDLESNTRQDKNDEENLRAVLKLALDKDGAQYRLRMTLKKLKEKYGMYPLRHIVVNQAE